MRKEIVMRATCLVVISMCLFGCAEIGHEPGHEDETVLAATAAPPLSCQPGEIFLESQDWWSKQTPTGEIDRGHVHTGLCWKHKGTLSGTVTLRVRTVLHDNPGTLEEISIQIWQDGASNNPNIRTMLDPVRTIANCTDTGGTVKDNGATCIWVDDIQVDTNLAPYDGNAQFRVRSILEEPDGEEMFTSTGLHATLANGGKPQWNGPYPNMNDMEARGWYTGAGYTTAFIYNPPSGPVSGIWSPVVAFKTGAGEPPNEHGDPVTGHLAALDTDFHNSNHGLVLLKGSGEHTGRLTIDTTRLENGWHRLFLKADATDSSDGATNSGVLVVFFEVQNAGTTALSPVADSYVRNGMHANTNYGTASEILVKDGGTDYERHTYLKFDLGSVSLTRAGRATLQLSIVALSNDAPVNVKVFGASGAGVDSWTETGITWNNRPTPDATHLDAIDDIPDTRILQLDVTSHVNAQLAGDRVMTLVLLDNLGTNRMIHFASREHTAELRRPTLVISPIAAAPPTDDAYVRAGSYAAANFGNEPEILVKDGGTEYDRQSYLRFDLTDIAGASISQALLHLDAHALSNELPAPVEVHPVTSDTWSESAITWSNKPTPGTTVLDSTIVGQTGRVTLDVTAFVQSQIAAGGDGIVSLALLDDTGANSAAHFVSQENKDKNLSSQAGPAYLELRP